MREEKASVEYLGLSLDGILERVILPVGDEAILVEQMRSMLGMGSGEGCLAGFL